MNYRSIEDLNRCIVSNLNKVPAETDLIVGIPRSGLLAANLLALQMNLPFTDLDGFLDGRILQSGERLKGVMKPFKHCQNIVVIEDSVWTGSSILKAKEKLKGIYSDKKILYLTVFASPDATSKVDIYFDICPGPRIFEWNMMHHNILKNCCVDIEGVLCQEPTEEDNHNEDNYERYLCNATLLLRPSTTIGYVVTNRIEKYRPQTEAWLAKNEIAYQKLIMKDSTAKEEQINTGDLVRFKASTYTKYGSWLFIANSKWQAKQIANEAGKPVYCMTDRKMFYPNILGKSKRGLRLLPEKFNSLINVFFAG